MNTSHNHAPDMSPTRPEGATFHECDECKGTGTVTIDGDELDCENCDGTGEWFE